MDEKPLPDPEPEDIVVKKAADAIADQDLSDVSGGAVGKKLLSGPFDDYSGGSYTRAGDPST